MNTAVIVTGAGGQLGRELLRTAPAGVTCSGLSRAELDIGQPGVASQYLAEHRPALVINAAAYTAVDAAEENARSAHQVNAAGAGFLASACAETGARLIHVSTDFVFDGSSSLPYAPGASTAPLGEYGRSKLAGEQAVADALDGALIVRTGWVYSAFGANFVKTMLRLMAERDELAVVSDQVGTPTWANGLAQALWRFAEKPTLQGIYHWSDAGVCSWYDFAVAIHEEARAIGLLERDVRIRPIPASEYPTPAQRPAYSVLDKSATWRDLGLEGVHWRRQLRAMLADLKEMQQ